MDLALVANLRSGTPTLPFYAGLLESETWRLFPSRSLGNKDLIVRYL
jgi:hypothetical protein